MRSTVILLVCLFFPVFAAEENLIRNGDFSKVRENGTPEQWSGRLAAGSGVVRGVTPSKGNALHLDRTGQLVWQTVKVEEGKSYALTYLLKTDFPKWLSAASCQILWLDASKKPLLTDYKGKKIQHMTIKNVQGSRDWQKIDFGECIAPKNAAYAQLRLCIAFDKDGTCWFADFCMTEKRQGDAFANRIASLPRRSEEVPMNDFFNRKYWENSAVFQDFLLPTTNLLAENQTSAEGFFTSEALYLNIKCSLPGADKMKLDPQMDFSMQESCEVFLRLPGQKHQYHIFTTADGVVRCFTETWNDGNWPMKCHPWKESEVVGKVEYASDGWRLGLRIPFRSLQRKAPADGEKWRMNICRGNYGKNRKELSAWSALREAHFQFPDDFGQVIFRDRDIPLLKSCRIDANGAALLVRNPSGKELSLRAAFVKHAKSGGWEFSNTTFSVPAGSERTFTYAMPSKNAEMRFLELRSGDALIAKHCNMPGDKYYAFGIFDPEGVRGKILNIAVDHPFFLGLNMRHNAKGKTAHRLVYRDEKAFDLYMEVPEGLDFREMIFDAGEWKQSPFIKPEKTVFQQNGMRMVRYKFELPFIINWAAPVYMFFYDCSLPAGREYSGSCYLTENGVELPRRELNFQTIEIGSVKRLPKRFGNDMFYIDAKIIRHLFPKNTLRHYTRLGMNRITVNVEKRKNNGLFSGSDPQTREDHYDLLFREMEQTGIRLFFTSNSSSATPQAWSWTHKDEDARAIGADGKAAPRNQYGYPSLCPTYRGRFFQQHIEKLKTSYLFSKYKCTWLTLDLELWPPKVWEKLCFCPRCLEEFKTYAAKQYPEYASCDVRRMFQEKKDARFMQCWNDFKAYLHRKFIRDLTDPVRAAAAGNPPSSPRKEFLIGEWCKPKAHLLDTIDLFELGLYYTPDVVQRHFEDIYRKWGDKKKNWYPTFTFGQTCGCPDFHMKPEQIPELIYEAAIYGAQGICWYYYSFVEPLRWKYVLEGINVIVPFEDLILDGAITHDVKIDNPKMQLTARRHGSERLIAVRAYKADSPQTATIAFDSLDLPADIYDCISGKKIAAVNSEKKDFRITVAPNRCRLLYVGSEKQWKLRMQGNDPK